MILVKRVERPSNIGRNTLLPIQPELSGTLRPSFGIQRSK
jgi:hypothetical protein